MQSLEVPLPQWSGRQAEAPRRKPGVLLSSRVQVFTEATVGIHLGKLMLAMLHTANRQGASERMLWPESKSRPAAL